MNATPTKTNERLRSLSPAIRRPRQGIIWSRNNSKTDLLYNYKYQQKIKQLKEEIKQLKQTENNQQEERREINTFKAMQTQKTISRLLGFTGAKRKHRTYQHHKFYLTNHDNFIKLRKTLEDNQISI